MAIEIVFHQRAADRKTVRDDLVELSRDKTSGCKRDAARIFAALERWQQVGFQNCPSLVFRPIEGPPSNGKMYEAKYETSARSDGVHGYRIFYIETRRPDGQTRVAVLLTLFAKEGTRTADAVITKAWEVAEEVRTLIDAGAYFPAE